MTSLCTDTNNFVFSIPGVILHFLEQDALPVEEWVADAGESDAQEYKDEPQPINHPRTILITNT